MVKRTTTKPIPTYPDPATQGFVEWVKTHLSKRSDRRAVLRVLDAVLRDLGFSEGGEALSLVRALGDPHAVLLAADGLRAPGDLAARRGLQAVVAAHLRSALVALVFSDPRVDFAARWRDAKMTLPERALAVCRELKTVYVEFIKDAGSETISTRGRTRRQEDQRQIRRALAALREVVAVLTDYADQSVRDDNTGGLPLHELLHDDEQRLLPVAERLPAVAALLPKKHRWLREFAETLVDTLKEEAEARKEAICLTLMALLPVSSDLQRVAAALKQPLIARKGGLRRAAEIQQQHGPWRTAAREIWHSNPTWSVTRVADRVRTRLGWISQADKTIEDFIRDLKPRP